ncbi:MAG: family 10 glycosylhydrolase [Archangium sp.]|nr:family 10 glycosylhydrolase [Archangium sp.]
MATKRLSLIPLLLLTACGPVAVAADGAVIDEDAGLEVDAGDVDAGADAGTSTDAGTPDAGMTDAGLPDAGRPDAGMPGDGGNPMTLVTVSHERELRGVWVASVLNLDWPASNNLSVDAGRASLTVLVDSMADAGLNALFFQVRPESDALYPSTLEPWSRFLTGTQGQHPGWDPLDELLRLAHARGLEVHAWVNPYRGLQSSTVTTAANHVTRTLASAAITYNGAVVMNPGEPAVRRHVEAVVSDLLERYDVDGLHFDDYFYPYPDMNGTPFPDSATYAGYTADGGTMNLGDWRRDNVNTLVREVMGIVTNDHPTVRFGISPFGIWRSNMPVPGLDAYSVISCDAPTWMANGWVDYLTPQLYWREGSAQDYSTLASWWAMRNMGGRHLFPGHAVHQLSNVGTAQNWPLSEIRDQIAITRSLKAQGAQGAVHFRSAFIQSNLKGVHTMFKTEAYAKPALPPVLPRVGASVAPAVPFVNVVGSSLSVTNPLPATVRFFTLYRELSPGQWELRRVLGGAQVSFPISSGTWAVSAIGRGGAESQGVKVVIP